MAAKGVAYLKRYGVWGFLKRAYRKVVLSRPVNYEKWKKSRIASKKELAMQKAYPFQKKITFGIYILGDGEKKQKTLESLAKQSYDRYLVQEDKKHTEDYLMILAAGTVLRPETLFHFAKAVEQCPEADFLYGDYDFYETDSEKTENLQCTPEFDLYYLRSRNYIGQMFVCSNLLAQDAALFYAMEQKEGIDSCLMRCAEKAEHAVRIPRLLSHQQKNGAEYKPISKENRWLDQPLLSVIIPNKDCAEQLEECVQSVITLGGYDNLEILIVENNSEQPQSFACYERLCQMDRRIRVMKWSDPFHYSRMNNDAAAIAKGEYLLFLNNDTKVISPGCLKELMNVGQQKDVGAVGARLYYADGTIQHAGVILGLGGVAGHALEGMTPEQYASYPFAYAVRQVCAVTAACMLVKKECFWQAGGFSEELRVAYNDIDLCMKMRKSGWKILYCPQAELFHYESQTRGLEMTREKAQRLKGEQEVFCRNWRRELDAGDPFYSPNLTLEKSDFSLKR